MKSILENKTFKTAFGMMLRKNVDSAFHLSIAFDDVFPFIWIEISMDMGGKNEFGANQELKACVRIMPQAEENGFGDRVVIESGTLHSNVQATQHPYEANLWKYIVQKVKDTEHLHQWYPEQNSKVFAKLETSAKSISSFPEYNKYIVVQSIQVQLLMSAVFDSLLQIGLDVKKDISNV